MNEECKNSKLCQKEEDLFKKWKQAREFKNFARDGAGKNFENQKVKLIVIGKETNDTDETWDWRDRLNKGVFYKNGKPIENSYNLYRWARFILEGPLEWKEYKKTEKDEEKRINIFSKIAFMNLKKESGKSKTNDNKFQKIIKRDKKFIKDQLNLYLNNDDIKIIFLCGNGLYTPIAEILGDEIKNSKEIWNNGKGKNRRFVKKVNDKLFIVKFYHFSYFGLSNEKYYNLMKEIKKAIDENISRN